LKLVATRRVEERLVRHALPEEVRKARGHFVRSWLQPRAVRHASELDAVEERRRLEQGGDDQPDPAPKVGHHADVERSEVARDLVVGERTPKRPLAEASNELLAARPTRLSGARHERREIFCRRRRQRIGG
jgi:hypothetical protein